MQKERILFPLRVMVALNDAFGESVEGVTAEIECGLKEGQVLYVTIDTPLPTAHF